MARWGASEGPAKAKLDAGSRGLAGAGGAVGGSPPNQSDGQLQYRKSGNDPLRTSG